MDPGLRVFSETFKRDLIPFRSKLGAYQIVCIFWLVLRHSVADVVREVKKSSNDWVCEQTGFYDFNWQEGYIASQVEQHRTKSFLTELMELLTFAKIHYDSSALD